MDEDEAKVMAWLKANGVVDRAVAKAVYSALDRPGTYGPYTVAYERNDLVLTGPASRVVLEGSNDIQAMRMRLDEIIANG
jgi:hypothetical protein